MIDTSTLSNQHLNGVIQARLYGDEVKYLTFNKLTDDYEPGSDPVYKDSDFDWIPVPNYAGDPGDAQFLRYYLAKWHSFVIEPSYDKFSVTLIPKDGSGASFNAVEITEARATVVALYVFLETTAIGGTYV